MVCFILVMRNGLCDKLGKTHKSILLRETFFAIFRGGGGGEFDTSREITGKNLARKKEYYRQHNFKPSKSFNRGNYTPDCRSAPFAKTVGLLA